MALWGLSLGAPAWWPEGCCAPGEALGQGSASQTGTRRGPREASLLGVRLWWGSVPARINLGPRGSRPFLGGQAWWHNKGTSGVIFQPQHRLR